MSKIFLVVEEKQKYIEDSNKLAGTQYMRFENDPFRLYQSYIEICKPLDYETSLNELEDENEKLKSMLDVEKARADTI